MKVRAVVEQAQRRRLPPLQRKVLGYIESHGEEVFTYRDTDLVRESNAKASAIGFTLWALHKQDLIGKQEVAGKMYFGSKGAISRLREQLGVGEEEAFVRADRNREHARQRHGQIDVGQLLDDVRAG